MNVQVNQIEARFKATEKTSHQLAIERFQDILHLQVDSESKDGSHEGRKENKSNELSTQQAALRFKGLPSGVLSVFNQSVEQLFSVEPSLLEHLVEAISKGVQAGKRLPGDEWRFSIRIKPNVLAMTSLEMSCMQSNVSVVLRTADADAYRSIVSALPRLNDALSQQNLGKQCATARLVNAKDVL